jgi:hypothetical protein
MRVKFVAPGEDTTRAYGRTFVSGELVDISDMPELARGKLAANPAFETEGAGDGEPAPTAPTPAEDLSRLSIEQLIGWLNQPPRNRAIEKGQAPKAELLRLAQEQQAAELNQPAG